MESSGEAVREVCPICGHMFGLSSGNVVLIHSSFALNEEQCPFRMLPTCSMPVGYDSFKRSTSNTWVVVKIMVPFWIPIIIPHLVFRVPKKGP